ncbi:554_t:CDS:10, partial [Funneliformis geosporum]
MNVPGYLKISDLLRQNEVKVKSKGKANAVDHATLLLKHANKVQEEWKTNLLNFKEILQKSRSIQNEFRDDELLEDEYGSDLIYNNLPTKFYYDDYSDSDSGLHEEDLDFDRDKNIPYDKEWLLGQCRLHIASFCDADGEITPEKLYDDIQTELVDLIGFDNLNFVTTLVTKRSTILENIISKSLYVEIPPDSQKHSSVTIIKPKEKNKLENERITKRLRKEQKKSAKQKSTEEEDLTSANILGFSLEKLRAIREQSLRNARDTPLRSKRINPSENYKHVFGNAQTGSVLSVFGTTYSLPVGTQREEFDAKIIIPITRRAPQMENEQLIHLNGTDNLCKGSFKASYKTLNRVQSLVYPVAYKKNDNLLICAPTGAGKTDIAILTILRTLKSFCFPEPLVQQEPQDFLIDKNEFKIVYIAPMKALAAEIVKKLGDRLKWIDVQVRELTGDMQLTKSEISNTQIIVTTPEKWDVITRKSTGDVELSQKVKLLIIDEIHLLHEDRGAVLESLVARTRRQIESSQKMIRIVGLSATLPNYVDVARFLGVDLKNGAEGLFYFDGGFRPVPLEQHFIGVKGKPGSIISNNNLNMVCWKKVLDLVREKHQVMIFVHSRKDTVRTAKVLHEFASNDGNLDLFDMSTLDGYSLKKRDVMKSRNKELKELFQYGLGIHHAGMLRADRSMTERLFSEGFIKVLCCTATLAWGVNLPAYAVIIKGTQVYNSQKGRFDDLSILDVMQIFGRAGRPQYETHGVGYILTTHDKLSHYVSAMTQQHPIESKFIDKMVDNLNAEISLGTVTNVDEGVRWLGYTYLFVRMKMNPLVYGMNYSERENDPELGKQRRELIVKAA